MCLEPKGCTGTIRAVGADLRPFSFWLLEGYRWRGRVVRIFCLCSGVGGSTIDAPHSACNTWGTARAAEERGDQQCSITGRPRQRRRKASKASRTRAAFSSQLEVRQMKWIGPYTIDELLDSCLAPSHPRPPESNGVYLISQNSWSGQPTQDCVPLYVGSNTGKSERFRTRIGDLIADMFGFFGDETGHHSGGQSLHRYCTENQLNPKKLYIGWVEKCACSRCTENKLYDQLHPLKNKSRPPRCKVHKLP